MNVIPKFASPIHEVTDAAEANELYQRNGWTDGLPIVAPTEDAVARFLAAAQLDASTVIGVEPVRRRSITAEKIAIAAVMASMALVIGMLTSRDVFRVTAMEALRE